MITSHPSKKMKLNGKLVDIDKEIYTLISEMNKLNLKTLFSCKGNDTTNNAYVSFDLSNAHFCYYPEKNKLTLYWNRKLNKTNRKNKININLKNIKNYINEKLYKNWKICVWDKDFTELIEPDCPNKKLQGE